MFIKIKEPLRSIFINTDHIEQILYCDYECTVIMKSGKQIFINNKKQMENLLFVLNNDIVEI